MGREYPTDTLWRAQELYCVDRLSYAAVAEATGGFRNHAQGVGAEIRLGAPP